MSWDDGEYYDASFAVHKCRRYHAKLRDFYRGAHRVVVIANIVAASGAFVAFMASAPRLGGYLSGVVAIASLYDYVFSSEKSATLHHELTRKFTDLAAKIELMEPTPENLRKVRAERIRIEADEPSVLRLIDLLAKNEEERCRGVLEADLIPLSWCQRRLGYFLTFGMERLEKWKAAKERARVIQERASS